MQFTITGSVDLTRNQGKFATRDEAAAALQEELDAAIGSFQFTGENGGEYEVSDYSIEVT
jgi:hypothetical protein